MQRRSLAGGMRAAWEPANPSTLARVCSYFLSTEDLPRRRQLYRYVGPCCARRLCCGRAVGGRKCALRPAAHSGGREGIPPHVQGCHVRKARRTCTQATRCEALFYFPASVALSVTPVTVPPDNQWASNPLSFSLLFKCRLGGVVSPGFFPEGEPGLGSPLEWGGGRG